MSDIWTDNTQYDDEGNPLPQDEQELLPQEAAPTEGQLKPIRGIVPPNIQQVINNASIIHGVDPDLMAKIARVESSYNPGAVTGSYKGLYQLSDQEFMKHGGGDIFNPQDNANAAAAKTAAEIASFKQSYGRDPSAIDVYMQHQQGVGGYAMHMKNPDAPAWENMLNTGEGRAKGAGWARAAIWGNVPNDLKRQFGSVDNITSADFVKLWERKLNSGGGGGGVPDFVRNAVGSGDTSTNRLQQRLQALKDVGPNAMQGGGQALPFMQNDTDPNEFVVGDTANNDAAQAIPLPDITEQKKPQNMDNYVPPVMKTFQQLMDWWNASGASLDKLKQDSALYQGSVGQLQKGGMQAVKGAYEMVTGLPFLAGAAGSAILGNLTDVSPQNQQIIDEIVRAQGAQGVKDQASLLPQNGPDTVDAPIMGWFMDQAAKMHKGAEWATGTGAPQTPFENVAESVGKGVVPGSMAWSGINTLSDIGVKYLPQIQSFVFPDAGAQEMSDTSRLLRMGIIKAVNVKVGNQDMIVPGITETGKSLTDEQARDYWTKGARNPAVVYDKAKALMKQVVLNPELAKGDEIVQTVAGPYRIPRKEYQAMGIVGAATLGIGFTPWVGAKLGKMVFDRVGPRPEPVPGGPAGLFSDVPRRDYFRTGDDEYAALINQMERAGVPEGVRNSIAETMRIQGGNSAHNFVSQAVSGQTELPNFSFNVKRLNPNAKSLEEMHKDYNDPAFFDYLHLRDTMDELNTFYSDPKKMQRRMDLQENDLGMQPGPPQIRGETVQSALHKINAHEQARPEFVDWAKDYQNNMQEVWRFLNHGEAATLSPADLRDLRATRRNFVPWVGEKVMDPVNTGDRGNPFEAAQYYMNREMRGRMANEIPVQWRKAVVQHSPYEVVTDVSHTDKRLNDYEETIFPYKIRGEQRYAATDPLLASIIKRDPYLMSGPIEGLLDATRQGMQFADTGLGRPGFSWISGTRNAVLAAISPRPGFKAINPFDMVAEVFRSTGPHIAKSISGALESLNSVIGSQAVDAIAAKMALAYENSFMARLEHAGMGHGGFLEASNDLNQTLRGWLGSIPGPSKQAAQGLFDLYRNIIGDFHNIGGVASARKNQGKFPSDAHAARYVRDITGDPMIGGARVGVVKPPVKARTHWDHGLTQLVGKGWVGGMQGLRTASPWFNISVQGSKRIAQAAIENPIKFNMRLWMYSQMPAALGYFWNMQAGKDPNGLSYTEYQNDMRSNYDTMMNQYLAIPGRPAADGIRIPMRPHELALTARFMEILLHHVFATNIHDTHEDGMNGLKSWFDIVTPLGLPPVVTAPLALSGVYLGGGPFSGYSAQDIKEDPFDADKQGWSRRMEMAARAGAGGIADWTWQAASAWAHTPKEEGKLMAARNAASAGVRRMTEQTPYLNDFTGLKPPMAGNNDTTQEMFRKTKAIGEVLRFIRASDDAMGAGGAIPVKPKSIYGGQIADEVTGPMPHMTEAPTAKKGAKGADYMPRMGLPIADPTNPLYEMFKEEVKQKFVNDTIDSGGIGYKTLIDRYFKWGDQIKSMRGIDEGNDKFWRQKMDEDTLKYLKENNVNAGSRREVQNFLETKRQLIAKTVLFTIKKVEDDMTQRLADPNVRAILQQAGVQLPDKVLIENLSPYKGKDAPDVWGLRNDLVQ